MIVKFDENSYETRKLDRDRIHIEFRAFEHIPYCGRPADEMMQKLSIYVPEAYYRGESINGYTLHTAPIFMPNTVGGYMPGPEEAPGVNFMGKTNTTVYALEHGYIVVSAGVRGRGMTNSAGKNIGIAPADIVDLKAAVRWLRFNKNTLPGDVEKIITNGTSAGGAMSSLQACTGDHPDYLPYLEEIEAADTADHVFASSCYCPITNLENADSAYEWEFCGINDYHRMKMEMPDPKDIEALKQAIDEQNGAVKPGPRWIPVDAVMSDKQIALSADLKKIFPSYLNSLGLKDEEGNPLELNEDGTGTFIEFIEKHVLASAQKELDHGHDLSKEENVTAWLEIKNGRAVSMDWRKYVVYRTRMKDTPAFDSLAMNTPENELYGSADIRFRHFTQFSNTHGEHGEIADQMQIKLMNPMYYIDDEKAVKAKHIRIRHGAVDRDTSLAISNMLYAKLMNQKIDVNLAHPWGIPHAGDYDLDELFAWIDNICK